MSIDNPLFLSGLLDSNQRPRAPQKFTNLG